MNFLERHPVKIKIATAVAVILFVIGATQRLTQDRDAALSEIRITQADVKRLQEKNKALERQICNLQDESRREDNRLQEQGHKAEIAYTEIKTKLLGVEALLVKIDGKLQ